MVAARTIELRGRLNYLTTCLKGVVYQTGLLITLSLGTTAR
uniref:Uncharacterized protein MANES_18G080300 n=1 Tax=Rhizophora mucronata TaxID=61149 RepID=A0A2P2JSF0_RHIMU